MQWFDVTLGAAGLLARQRIDHREKHESGEMKKGWILLAPQGGGPQGSSASKSTESFPSLLHTQQEKNCTLRNKNTFKYAEL